MRAAFGHHCIRTAVAPGPGRRPTDHPADWRSKASSASPALWGSW